MFRSVSDTQKQFLTILNKYYITNPIAAADPVHVFEMLFSHIDLNDVQLNLLGFYLKINYALKEEKPKVLTDIVRLISDSEVIQFDGVIKDFLTAYFSYYLAYFNQLPLSIQIQIPAEQVFDERMQQYSNDIDVKFNKNYNPLLKNKIARSGTAIQPFISLIRPYENEDELEPNRLTTLIQDDLLEIKKEDHAPVTVQDMLDRLCNIAKTGLNMLQKVDKDESDDEKEEESKIILESFEAASFMLYQYSENPTEETFDPTNLLATVSTIQHKECLRLYAALLNLAPYANHKHQLLIIQRMFDEIIPLNRDTSHFIDMFESRREGITLLLTCYVALLKLLTPEDQAYLLRLADSITKLSTSFTARILEESKVHEIICEISALIQNTDDRKKFIHEFLEGIDKTSLNAHITPCLVGLLPHVTEDETKTSIIDFAVIELACNESMSSECVEKLFKVLNEHISTTFREALIDKLFSHLESKDCFNWLANTETAFIITLSYLTLKQKTQLFDKLRTELQYPKQECKYKKTSYLCHALSLLVDPMDQEAMTKARAAMESTLTSFRLEQSEAKSESAALVTNAETESNIQISILHARARWLPSIPEEKRIIAIDDIRKAIVEIPMTRFGEWHSRFATLTLSIQHDPRYRKSSSFNSANHLTITHYIKETASKVCGEMSNSEYDQLAKILLITPSITEKLAHIQEIALASCASRNVEKRYIPLILQPIVDDKNADKKMIKAIIGILLSLFPPKRQRITHIPETIVDYLLRLANKITDHQDQIDIVNQVLEIFSSTTDYLSPMFAKEILVKFAESNHYASLMPYIVTKLMHEAKELNYLELTRYILPTYITFTKSDGMLNQHLNVPDVKNIIYAYLGR